MYFKSCRLIPQILTRFKDANLALITPFFELIFLFWFVVHV